MGHSIICDKVFGHPSLDDAYNHLRDIAEWDGGWRLHGQGVRQDNVCTTPILSDSEDVLDAIYEDAYERVHSGEPALGIPLIKVIPAKYEHVRTENIVVDFTSAEIGQHNLGFSSPFLTDLGKKKVAKVLGVKMDEIDSIMYDYRAPTKRKYTLKYKAETGAGKAETRYFVINKGERDMPSWDKGFASQAEARASVSGAKEINSTDKRYFAGEFEIIGMIRRQDGGALVHAASQVTKATVPLEVNIRRKVSERKVTNERGWMIIGSYHY